ncbi:MAG: AAA family ATPase [Chloroflexi bacterium AL-W]|nr:AAA family ATPase [Chloroflexi bacterium AL-N1]NOK67494.1 AAA family ATPase [Chloroflexi bacterium AL-N10]NOK75014.1 AAA family ATPase [Chloroflexi bacterium AL-N5]NOK81801.1 AAA family ATPase [Chloroflexi bacterium AL-W]NOK89647.1 AAA family ATPase [Chloroflexi bacterium AL-N15]
MKQLHVPSHDWTFPFCPAAPDWHIDWSATHDQLAWLTPLAETPQDPHYHAEGDVLTHTRMVVEELIALPEWRNLDQLECSMLFAAALLHDIAKPICTKIELNGAIVSPGHARVGANMTRQILWEGQGLRAPIPVTYCETIVQLVRFHGLPLWFLDKFDPVRAVIQASQTARLDLVALLAEADARGRICTDQQSLINRIMLFREWCVEQRCYTAPRTFETDHSRFVYFHREHSDPDYVAYDDTANRVILMVGLPGAGKDTWTQQHCTDWSIVSLDQIRREHRIDPKDLQGKVVQLAKEQARVLLRRREPFVWNATNLTRSIRRMLIDLFDAYKARTHIVYLDTSLHTLFERNRVRQHQVPEVVLRKFIRKLEIPDTTEAHHVEWLHE